MQHHIVITGGTGALGQAVTHKLAAENAVCHVTQIPAENLKKSHDRVVYHALDCSNEADVTTFYESLPRLDASVHLVGGFQMNDVTKTSLADFRSMFDLNVVTAFLCSREAAKKFRIQKSGGAIVNIASRVAVQPTAGMIAYATTKCAVAAMTQALAEELKHDGILVNAILPSIMDTPTNRTAMPNADFSKWPKVEDVAAAIAQLCSADNRLISGALVPVFGEG
jgi:NAD(P)-dependent dehydrogenase (short-subunit alcohol dehydrogenase family)